MADDDVIIEHPNRDKASSKAMRASVVLLLIVSVVLLLVVTIAGWEFLQGAQIMQIGYILLYVLFAYYVARWNRGVLPVISALAIVLAIFAIVSAPGWFDRDQPGFDQPSLDGDVLGLICIVLVPVQLLLIAVAMRGFQQAWNVEVERHPGDGHAAAPAPA
jgi:hypothetical protein